MIVLSSFLGGLALGNYFIGKRIDTSANPVRIYALLELSIGFYCLLYPTSSDLLASIFFSTASHLNIESQNIIFIILRLVISSLLLFIPTFAMGGTLPVLGKYFADKISRVQKNIGWLYFLNSIGAVAGVILAGFFLIKEYGLDFTIYSASVVNIGLGLIALLISKFVKSDKVKSDNEIETVNRNEVEFITPKIVNLAIITAGISGMAALLYEMVWVRLLVHFLGSSTYAFSIMLAAFIAGIAIGSFIVSKKFIHKFNRIKLLIFSQTAIAFGIVLSLFIYERLPYYLWIIASWFHKTDTTFNFFLSIEFLICFGLMFISTLFMGITLPTVVDIVANSDKKIGFSVGKVFSVNTIGTVVGVFVTTLILIPWFGIKGSFQIGIGLNLLAALLLLQSYDKILPVFKNVISAGLIILFLFLNVFSPAWNVKVMNSSVFRMLNQEPTETYSEFENLFSGYDVLYYKEGVNANVAVFQKSSPGEGNRALIINGKADASSVKDKPTQILVGQIPMMLHKNPQNVFVLGFGSGSTIGSVLFHDVKNVTCAEISTEVIEAAQYFRDVNYDCLNDPRLKIVHEDAHTYMNLSKDNYDVIISEPSNPWIAGIGNLFSKEYFQLCADRMKDDGIMVQWLQVYESNNEVIQLVLNTFCSVFPHCQIWRGDESDLILVGSEKEIELDENKLKSKFEDEKLKEHFRTIGMNSPFVFLSTQLLSDRGSFLLAREEPVNTENHPTLEFLAPRSLYLHGNSDLVFSKDEKFDTLNTGLYIKNYVKGNIPTQSDLLGTAFYHREVTRNYRFTYGLTKYLESESQNDFSSDFLSHIAYQTINENNRSMLTSMLENLINKYPDSIYVQQDYFNSVLAETTASSTFLKIFSMKDIAQKFIKASSDNWDALPGVYLQIAEGFFHNSEIRSAFIVCNELEKLLSRNPQIISKFPMDRFYYVFANVLYHLNYTNKYSSIYTQFVQRYPDSPLLIRLRKQAEWDNKN